MEKWIAAFLQLMAAALFIVVGAEGEDAFILLAPAVVSNVSGLLLWGRERRSPPPLAPKAEPPTIEAKVDRIEDTLVALQMELAQLRDDREFFRELYAAEGPRQKLNG